MADGIKRKDFLTLLIQRASDMPDRLERAAIVFAEVAHQGGFAAKENRIVSEVLLCAAVYCRERLAQTPAQLQPKLLRTSHRDRRTYTLWARPERIPQLLQRAGAIFSRFAGRNRPPCPDWIAVAEGMERAADDCLQKLSLTLVRQPL